MRGLSCNEIHDSASFWSVATFSQTRRPQMNHTTHTLDYDNSQPSEASAYYLNRTIQNTIPAVD